VQIKRMRTVDFRLYKNKSCCINCVFSWR